MQFLIMLKFEYFFFYPELLLKNTESTFKINLIELSTQVKGFKFVKTLFLVFKKKENEDKTKYGNIYSISKAEIINEGDIDGVFQLVCTTIISNIQKSLGKGSGWIIDSVIDHTISISKYNP